ncbi:gti1/Pac2 family domain-containing protein [Hirsutella rhossiliensis]|uniref:Gti1/Pac2 family domain-containing protein n=1 Tax=Hirsutella rhossiliensis TaxID=111463 RepID=A0A9P8SG48_9HYPO|nr:gti1/Pac2 family domain-containing protein [Hirsutella rhossiliensis]KAH0960065.1 gti1/Pac2 family domain-containing protein [Hirsutella rhossiliensis]
MSNQSSPLNPTWQGHIASTLDALMLFEGSLGGLLNHVPRRPHDRERQDLIQSGSVFIYEEHASGIKRWTDGVSWSPSRILGNFLIYRELEKPFPPGEKKRALKKKNISSYVAAGIDLGKDTERSLIGSLIDSYPFKTDGLVKKTISITYRGVPHHLVSYYSVEDVMSGRLMTPSKDNRLREIVPRMELMTSQNFRAPVDEVDASGSILQRAWSGPGIHTVPVPAYTTSPAFAFPPGPHHSYVSSMGPSMGVPMSSSMPPPLPSSMTSPSPGNYALDPNRTARFGSGAGIANEFPRNMPTQSPPRRHSTFGATPSNGNAYIHQPSYYLPHRGPSINAQEGQNFPSPRQMKMEATGVGPEDGAPQQYGLDESSSAWNFDTIDGPHDQQYFGSHATNGAAQQWQSNANSLGRT